MTLPISSSSPPPASGGTRSTKAAAGTDRLGKQDFLQLLIAQMRNQDPMKPMEDKEYITQLAQFSTLETMQNLDKRFEELTLFQALSQSAAMVGKRITAKLADGTTVSGVVSEVKLVDGSPRYMVDGKAVEPSQVTSVGG